MMRWALRLIGWPLGLLGVLSVVWAFFGPVLAIFIGGQTEILAWSKLGGFIVTRGGVGVLSLGISIGCWRLASRQREQRA